MDVGEHSPVWVAPYLARSPGLYLLNHGIRTSKERSSALVALSLRLPSATVVFCEMSDEINFFLPKLVLAQKWDSKLGQKLVLGAWSSAVTDLTMSF